MTHDNVTDIEKFVDDYIAVYEDAPNWGGPTMYPAPLTIKQVKALRTTIVTLRKQLENARSENAKLEAELDSLHRDISMGMYGSQS